jgi:hypothetical protein
MTSFERTARARKVSRLVSIVPRPETRDQAARLAMTLAAFTVEQRRRWAEFAGCKAPSSLTWAMCVATVRNLVSQADNVAA